MFFHLLIENTQKLQARIPPLSLMPKWKNLRRLKDLLDNNNELMRKFLSQQLNN